MDRKAQLIMGSVFTGMGVATMLFPKTAAEMSFKKDFLGKEGVTPSLKLTMQCFGSQASLCGLVILSSKFDADTFKYFGLAMIPCFIFDFHFWHTGALTTIGAVGDALGNIIFSTCCFVGFNALIIKK